MKWVGCAWFMVTISRVAELAVNIGDRCGSRGGFDPEARVSEVEDADVDAGGKSRGENHSPADCAGKNKATR